MYREDYARAGYKMLPAFDLDSRFTRAEIVAFHRDLDSHYDVAAARPRGRVLCERHVPGRSVLALSSNKTGEINLQRLGQPRPACLGYLPAHSSWSDCRPKGLKFPFSKAGDARLPGWIKPESLKRVPALLPLCAPAPGAGWSHAANVPMPLQS